MSNIYDLAAFQRALDVVAAVYEMSSRFPDSERYNLTRQMRRAAVAVCSDIAEGQGRLTFGERRQFLSQARGSLFEVEAQVMIAHRLGFINDARRDATRLQIRKCAAALAGFIRWVQNKERMKYPATRQPGNSVT
jgi:four helix bundle protein